MAISLISPLGFTSYYQSGPVGQREKLGIRQKQNDSIQSSLNFEDTHELIIEHFDTAYSYPKLSNVQSI